MSGRSTPFLALLLCAAAANARGAEDKDKGDSKFKSRFAQLVQKQEGKPISIKMAANEAPDAILAGGAPGGVINVAGGRTMPGFEPSILSTEDMLAVVNGNMVAIRTCYKQQLSEDPEWAEEMILDIAVRKTGRVAEVSISPGRVKRSHMGQCLRREVEKWKFPQFTGEVGEVVQEVVNASFPFSFSSNPG